MSDNKYPDLEPDGLGDLKSIKAIKGMPGKNIPQIAWGEQFKAWPVQQQLSFAKKVASAMNHAADLLQKERDELLDICIKQERQIEALQKANLQGSQTAHAELQSQGEERQQLYKQIMELQSDNKRLRKLLREAGLGE